MTPTRAPRSSVTTRADLIEAGLGLIMERGYNHTGLDEILRTAGVAKGSFYHFFKSKEDFGLEVVARHAERRLASLDEHLGDAEHPHLARLRRFFEGSIRRHEDQGFRRGCLFGNLGQEMADQSEVFRGRLEEVLAEYRRRIAGCLRQAQEEGELRLDLDPDRLAGFVLNSWEGAILRMKVAKARAPLDDFLDLIFATVLGPPPPT